MVDLSLRDEHARFQAPFIFKLSYYPPNARNSDKNAAHISYIGKRTGVDLGIELDAIQDNSAYAEFTAEANDQGTAAGHVKYADERPGSHGLFGSEKESFDLQLIQNELREHRGIVWRIILSLKEEDARLLDFDSRKSWETALRAAVPDAASKFGIGESNLRWTAAFHQEKGHPHVHLVMWEKTPKRTKGKLSKGERQDVKNVFMREIYAEERTRLSQEKTAMRDIIRDFAKDNTTKAIDLIHEIRNELENIELDLQAAGAGKTSIAPKLYPDELKPIIKGIDRLAEQLPGHGRIALKFLPEETKEKARHVADQMMVQPDLKNSLQRYLKSVEDLTRLHTRNPEKISQAKSHAYADLRDRVANVVVRGAVHIAKHKVKAAHKPVSSRPPVQRTELMNTVKSIWKSVWRTVDQVRIQNQAKGEIERQRMSNREKQLQHEQRSQDYER